MNRRQFLATTALSPLAAASLPAAQVPQQHHLRRSPDEIRDHLFYSQAELEQLKKEAKFSTGWDFSRCLGDTIKEKYEDLYNTLHMLSTDIKAMVGPGSGWVCCGKMLASIFETSAAFHPSPILHIPLKDRIRYVGMINLRWRLFISPKWNDNPDILVGAMNGFPYFMGTQRLTGGNVGVIKTVNFLV